ncbi:MAG: Na/Pi cotransporter family protein [Proteobacteria bacterium]|nr:Na/Pi cotransporter family protein [Pseudomonadota bacterium]
MDVQSVIFGTLGGLAIFLFGMNLMSDGLKNMGSASFKRILRSLTKNKLTAILVGTGITCLIQSSSATSVMVVGFVNAGLLIMEQAVAVVLGADIGTTITAWIVSTMGLGKFKMATYALPVIAVGFLINFISKKRKNKMIGQALLGFGLLFLGLGTMSDGVRSLKDSDLIMNVFMRFGSNPFLGILAGVVITIIIQSSSASIAIVQVMAFQGIFGLDAALALMLGANIGTTITAQLAAIGGTKAARGVAMANSVFKILGTILFIPLLLLGWYEEGVRFFISDTISNTGTNGAIMAQIAIAHTAFITINVVIFSTILWPILIKLAKRLSSVSKSSDENKERPIYLDPLLLNTPSIALEQCVKEIAYMTELCHQNITASFEAFIDKDINNNEKIEKREDSIDDLQSDITSYLVQLSRLELSVKESKAIPRLIHCINDAERAGDHAENLMELTELAINNKLLISIEAKRDLHNYFDLIDRQFKAVIKALETRDGQSVADALMLEERINADYDVITQNHVERLEKGECDIPTGVVFIDMITNFEKIGDHLTNIAERVTVQKSYKTAKKVSDS